MRMNLILAACLMTATAGLAFPGRAFADESVAGHWRADLGNDITIEMNVTPNGHWSSTTAQHGERVAEMDGNYRQTISTRNSGRLVFVPRHADVSGAHGAAKVEYDTYRLSDNDETLQLTSSGDMMEFHKVIH